MTALDRFETLEASAVYREGPNADPIDVVVSFGGRSLMIVDLQDQAIAHWPLATLRGGDAGNASELAVRPDDEASDIVRMVDPEMIAALREICPQIGNRVDEVTPKVRRPFAWIMIVLLCVLTMWSAVLEVDRRLPHLIPTKQRVALSDTLLDRLSLIDVGGISLSVRLCTEPAANAALQALIVRLSLDQTLESAVRLAVIDVPGASALVLPAGDILLSAGVIRNAASPEDVAAMIAHLGSHAIARDPERQIVDSWGRWLSLQVAFDGLIDDDAIDAALAAVLNDTGDLPGEAPATTEGQARLVAADLPADGPFRFAAQTGPIPSMNVHHVLSHDQSGAAPSFAGAFDPALTDGDWLALQNICDEQAVLNAQTLTSLRKRRL